MVREQRRQVGSRQEERREAREQDDADHKVVHAEEHVEIDEQIERRAHAFHLDDVVADLEDLLEAHELESDDEDHQTEMAVRTR